MRDRLRLVLVGGVAALVGLVLTTGVMFGQTSPAVPKAPAPAVAAALQGAPAPAVSPAAPAASLAPSANLTFEVASIRPSDMAKLQSYMQDGKILIFGMHLNGLRVESDYQTLRDLMADAYKVRTYQITGPDWLSTEQFDIMAKMPEGSTKADAPKMLQALLEDRFKLTTHRETKEHPVMALVVGKGGPKMKESPGDAPPIDEQEPLKAGETQMDSADGPMRMIMNKNGMGATMNMGTQGNITWGVDMQTMMLHVSSSKVSMTALADILTRMVTQMGGAGGSGKQIVNMTGLKGNYEVAMEFSMADLNAQAQGGGSGSEGAGGRAATVASDPGGSGQTVATAMAKLGLKLDSRQAPVEQLIVDHAEKTPTEN